MRSSPTGSWGSLLAAFALTWAFGPAQGERPFAACLLLILLSAAGYLPVLAAVPSAPAFARAWARGYRDPLDYVPLAFVLAESACRHDQANLVDPGYWLHGQEKELVFRKYGYIPPVEAGDVLRLKGRVLRAAGPVAVLRVRVAGRPVLESVQRPGPFSLEAVIPWGSGDRPAEFDLSLQPPLLEGELLMNLSGLTVARPADRDARALLPVEDVLPVSRFGRKTFAHVHSTRPALVQLPVLFYKGLLEVRDNGKPVPYGNL